jgi:hypothetical protein
MTMHWDGTQWTLIPNPLVVGQALYGVVALASNDVWAVGDAGNSKSLAMHWDGFQWSIVPTPNPPGASQSFLWGLAAVSPSDLWSVSGAVPQGAGAAVPLVEHFSSPCQMELLRVVSRKSHGNAGTFDVDLTAGGIECRSGDPDGNYTMVFTFANPLTNVAGVSVTGGTGSVASSNIDGSDPHSYVVNLTGVTNAQRVTVTLQNLADAVGNKSSAVSAQMAVLIGDVNGSSRVDAADVSLVRQQTLQAVTSSNFRQDINASGRIDSADVSIARQQTLTALP